eukprot:scaffold2182_cov363-Pavlova_lutheri.AAC.2
MNEGREIHWMSSSARWAVQGCCADTCMVSNVNTFTVPEKPGHHLNNRGVGRIISKESQKESYHRLFHGYGFLYLCASRACGWFPLEGFLRPPKQ